MRALTLRTHRCVFCPQLLTTSSVSDSELERSLDNLGMLFITSGTQAARRNYAEEVANLRTAPDGSQCSVDLARIALEIAAEDDALISHSPVPLPVDAYLNRLQAMALEFAGHYLPPQCDNPHNVLEALDLYLVGYQVCRFRVQLAFSRVAEDLMIDSSWRPF